MSAVEGYVDRECVESILHDGQVDFELLVVSVTAS